MTRQSLLLLTAVAALQCLGCSPATEPRSLQPELLTVPAGDKSTSPRISSSQSGEVVLSWLQPDAEGLSLHYARLVDGHWGERHTVVTGATMFVNWADLPSVVPLGDGQMAAHWLDKKPYSTYSYDVIYSQSHDDGVTWSAPMSPHSDGTPTEHGFVSMFRSSDKTGVIWLDGRKTVNEVLDDPTSSGMTLRATFLDKEQNLHGDQLVDELICDCCPTDVAIAASGPIAVYRDRSPDEIRDIYVTRHIDGKWQEGKRVGVDNWEIAGCPVNGPSIAATGDSVAIAWFTAARSRPVVRLAVSSDSGNSFADPQDITSDATLGRVGVVMLDDGAVAVSWLQTGENGKSEVRARKINADGKRGPERIVSFSASSFAVPQMARAGDKLIFAWSEVRDGSGHIASASIAVGALTRVN